MWQRFTERARAAVFYAQEAAGSVGDSYVDTEHLLLGVIRDESTVAVRMLMRMGVTAEQIRSKIELQAPPEPAHLGADMQITPRTKRAIDLAYEEAKRISDNYIGSEHLLLGLIREEEGVAGRVLAEAGVDLDRTREQIEALQDNDRGVVPTENVPQQSVPQSLGDYLIKKGYASEQVVEGAKKIQQATQGDLAKILIDVGVNLTCVYEAMAQERGLPFIDVSVYEPDQSALDAVPVEVAQRLNVLPVKRDGNILYVAMSDANDLAAADELRQVSGCTVRGALAVPAYIIEAIDRHYPSDNRTTDNITSWKGFTRRSKRTMLWAQQAAYRLGELQVSTEHLLLGLVQETDSVALRILDRMGITVAQIRSELDPHLVQGEVHIGQKPEFSPSAKRAIDLTYEEARALNNDYVATEHILLGLIREEEGIAARVLAQVGVDLDRIREAVVALQDNDSGYIPPPAAGQPETTPSDHDDQPTANRPEDSPFPAHSLKKEIQKDVAHWSGQSLVSLFDVTPEQVMAVLNVAAGMKAGKQQDHFVYFRHPKTMALLFEKPSLRTRVSFETGMADMAGHAIYLAPADVGLGVRESVADVAAGLSRWVDVIAARTFKHETVVELAESAKVPVINALSDREHPIQAFADLLTIMEAKGDLGNHLKLAYIGDGNNVLHALLLACAKVGVNLTAACPQGYEPDAEYVREAQKIGSGEYGTGAHIEVLTDPVAAVNDADVVYTDVWTSMGQEEETALRLKFFAPYQINSALLAHAKSDVIVLHCLPAHREEEITTEVMDAYKTIIQDQAENRLHTQKALVALMLGL